MQNFLFFPILRSRVIFFLLFSYFSAGLLQAQKIVTQDQQGWLGAWNQTRLNNRWGIWFEGQYQKRGNFIDSLLEINVGLGLIYYITDDFQATAAYANVDLYPDGVRKILQPERRPWQQLQWHTRYEKLRLIHRIRLEERFRRHVNNGDELTNYFDFNYRARYNFLLAVALTKKGFGAGGWTFILNDEINLNFGDEIVYNTFDQNRVFTGFAYHFTSLSNLQFGYLNVFQQYPDGKRYREADAFRIYYYHNLDFRTGKH